MSGFGLRVQRFRTKGAYMEVHGMRLLLSFIFLTRLADLRPIRGYYTTRSNRKFQ